MIADTYYRCQIVIHTHSARSFLINLTNNFLAVIAVGRLQCTFPIKFSLQHWFYPMPWHHIQIHNVDCFLREPGLHFIIQVSGTKKLDGIAIIKNYSLINMGLIQILHFSIFKMGKYSCKVAIYDVMIYDVMSIFSYILCIPSLEIYGSFLLNYTAELYL